MTKILITGSAGFIGSYLVQEFLSHGYDVVGLDNFSKYGEIGGLKQSHERFSFVQGDAKDIALLKSLLSDCDHFIAGAAMIGGISYFHKFAYDLIAENERITAAAFDAALHAFQAHKLQKITVISSSMVFENATLFPSPEGHQAECPPPESTYGFQKLAVEYFARGAFQQYQMPFTIVRPFNCVGVGEYRAKTDHEVLSGDIKLAMSHVVPDLIQKLLKGQKPLRLLGSGQQIRHYTYGGDLARGIRLAVESPNALNQDFNISTAASTTVVELAEAIWNKIFPGEKFEFITEPGFPHDVQKRVPDVSKAREQLGFEATTPLSDILDEVIPWVQTQIQAGLI